MTAVILSPGCGGGGPAGPPESDDCTWDEDVFCPLDAAVELSKIPRDGLFDEADEWSRLFFAPTGALMRLFCGVLAALGVPEDVRAVAVG